jgi:hypothetical protein
MVRMNLSLTTVLLLFNIRHCSVLCEFRFYSFAHAFVIHLLEFLQFRKLISPLAAEVQTFVVRYRKKDHSKEFGDSVTPLQLFALSEHRSILKSILADDMAKEDRSLDVQECLHFFDPDGRCLNFTNLKREVFRRGLTPEARQLIWPLLLGVQSPTLSKDSNDESRASQLTEYRRLRSQWTSIVKAQKAEIGAIAELVRVVENDVRRTDRQLPHFRNETGPNMSVLNNVLISYAIYNKDTGYVQGMGDLLSPLIVLLIDKWESEDCVLLNCGKTMSRDEIESYLFWMLAGVLSTMQQDRMFTELALHQQFAMERVHAMATRFHEPLKRWLAKNHITELMFLYRPLLLLFKREFAADVVARLWDSFFAAVKPDSFPRFLLSALLIIMFPRLVLETSGDLGDVMSASEVMLSEIDGLMALNLAVGLEQNIRDGGTEAAWILASLPEKAEFRDYKSKYLSLQ